MSGRGRSAEGCRRASWRGQNGQRAAIRRFCACGRALSRVFPRHGLRSAAGPGRLHYCRHRLLPKPPAKILSRANAPRIAWPSANAGGYGRHGVRANGNSLIERFRPPKAARQSNRAPLRHNCDRSAPIDQGSIVPARRGGSRDRVRPPPSGSRRVDGLQYHKRRRGDGLVWPCRLYYYHGTSAVIIS